MAIKDQNTLDDFDPSLRPTLERSLEGIEFFDQLIDNSAAKVPEPIFVQHILPMLTNREGKQDLTRWQQVAGHVMRPIDVVDSRTKEVLFRVPALLRSLQDHPTGSGENSIYEILRTAEQKRRVIPAMGDAHIKHRLVDRVPPNPVNVDDIIAWNEILKRYGKEPILKVDVAPEAKADSTDSGVDDTGFAGEYDDL